MGPVCKMALLVAAMRRNEASGIGFSPPITKPSITRRHIDGPYLSSLDGRIFWLSPWERLLTKLGIWDAWDIEWRKCPLPPALNPSNMVAAMSAPSRSATAGQASPTSIAARSLGGLASSEPLAVAEQFSPEELDGVIRKLSKAQRAALLGAEPKKPGEVALFIRARRDRGRTADSLYTMGMIAPVMRGLILTEYGEAIRNRLIALEGKEHG